MRENFGLPTLSQDTRRGLLSHARTRERLARYVERLRITMRDPEDPITTLSGGNQQKIVMARWLATDPQLLLFNDPTRGVDLGAKRDLYALLAELAAQGVGVVMLSTEVDEHVELMDRVLVFREGTIFCELPRADLSRQVLVAAFFGGAPACVSSFAAGRSASRWCCRSRCWWRTSSPSRASAIRPTGRRSSPRSRRSRSSRWPRRRRSSREAAGSTCRSDRS